jgi:hypothetical protein
MLHENTGFVLAIVTVPAVALTPYHPSPEKKMIRNDSCLFFTQRV